MVKSYQKILDMESMIMLRLEQNRKKLDNIRQILYHEKDSIINTLIKYLKIDLNKDYFKYKIIDINNNMTHNLSSLLTDYPNVDILAMGFPANWKNEPLWKILQ